MSHEGEGRLRALLPVFSIAFAFRRAGLVEAVAEKGQQLLRRAKAQFPACIDLLDAALEMTPCGMRPGPQLKHEGAPLHTVTLRAAWRSRCENPVEVPVKVSSEALTDGSRKVGANPARPQRTYSERTSSQ
jgi:hypothetical protein